MGQAEALLGSARSYYFEVMGDVWETLCAGNPPSSSQRASCRLCMAHLTQACVQAVALMYKAGGGSALYAEHPLDRYFRDIHTLNQHVIMSQKTYQTAGRVFLGLEPGGAVLLEGGSHVASRSFCPHPGKSGFPSSLQDKQVMDQMTRPGFLVTGALVVIPTMLLHWVLPEEYMLESLGILGGLLGGIYAGMGVLSTDRKKEMLQIGLGMMVAGFACAGLWVSPVFFALLCFTHGIWDVISGHPKCLNFRLVNWYVPMCMSYAFLLGVFLLIWWGV